MNAFIGDTGEVLGGSIIGNNFDVVPGSVIANSFVKYVELNVKRGVGEGDLAVLKVILEDESGVSSTMR